jgi:AraC family transcriptional activator of tynA and feaB
MMESSGDFSSPPELDYEGWRDLLRSLCGRYNPEGINPKTFAGWVRPVNVCGFTALNIACNAGRVERTYRDVRLDGADHYFAVFQLAGQSAMNHNDQAVRLAVGDVALVDVARPLTALITGASPGTSRRLICRARRWFRILGSTRRVVFADTAERLPDACS